MGLVSCVKKVLHFVRGSEPAVVHVAASTVDVPTRWLGSPEDAVLHVVTAMQERGATQDDVLKALLPLGYSYGTITPRFSRLLDKGLLIDTKRKRVAASGRKQRVVVAFKEGYDYF